jgi:DNA-binding NarL/FixJ family response regulator
VIPAGTVALVTRTVLIVDDHPAVRSAARRVLEQDGFDVVAEGGSGQEALEAAEALRPGIVLLDVALPDADGVEVARRLTAAGEAPAVVLTSSRAEADIGDAVEDCGARGFIPKEQLSGAAIAALAA